MELKYHYVLASVLTAASTAFLAAFVYLKSRRTQLNILYSSWALCVGLWSFFLVLSIFATSKASALLWCRLLHVWAIILPAIYVHFVLLFLEKADTRRRLIFFLYVLAGFFVIADFSPWFITSTLRPKFDFYVTQPLLLYPFHIMTFVLSVVYVNIELIHSLHHGRGRKSKQVQYFFAATVIGYSGGITNYLINYDLLIYPFYPYGNYTICIYVIVIGLGILRYGFMDIEVIIRKTIVFAGLTSFILGIFTIVTFIAKGILNHYIAVGSSFINVASVILIVVCYEPLRNFLINFTDRYLFQKKINYRILLKEATEYLAHLDSLKWQARRIIAFLLLKARITNACIYSFHSFAPGSLLLQASRPRIKVEGHKTIVLSHPLIQYMKIHRGSVELRILEEAKASEKDLEKVKALDQMIGLFKEHKAEAAIPCFGSGAAERARHTELHLRGILFLGHQKSDEPYTEEDLDLLFTLGQESSIAFENARLYDEAIERAQELGLTNQQLNDAQTRLMSALSEAERANERLRVTQAALIVAEKNATMVGMAKAIGHEVNNPLATVDGRAKWIYRDLVTACLGILDRYNGVIEEDDFKKLVKSLSNIDDHAQRISHSAKRIEYVVKTLTNILKDTKGEMGPLSLTVMCHEAIEATRFQTYDENLSGCDIDLDIVANVMVRGNLEQLLQVLVNLIKNAYEAMGKQKERSITIRGYADPEDSKMARIEVSDNGPGIPSEMLPKIWTQGFSTKVKTSDGIGAHGQGQGLFVCKHMIESIHGGLIYAESTAGKGTTFVIKLPLASD